MEVLSLVHDYAPVTVSYQWNIGQTTIHGDKNIVINSNQNIDENLIGKAISNAFQPRDISVFYVPDEMGPFLGHEKELCLVADILLNKKTSRFCKLFGEAGFGKSRIALRLAHQFRARYRGSYQVKIKE